MDKASWKERAFQQQMSQERDFPGGVPVRFQYAICCGHRTGSNLLGEALYQTGNAGDPMEYFNLRFLRAFSENLGVEKLDLHRYLEEMKSRRTSPNGVFGMNVKYDQLSTIYKGNFLAGLQIIKEMDFVLFLYRKDKLRQAISSYIGQSKDTYNIPVGVSDEFVRGLVDSVPFSPEKIAARLSYALQIDMAWLNLFKDNEIKYEPLAYEDFIENYEDYIDYLLEKFGVPQQDRHIPKKPLKKISNQKNEEFLNKFIDFLSGRLDFEDVLSPDYFAGVRKENNAKFRS